MTATQNFRIAAIPADGVGLEVVEAGRAVLDSLAGSSGGRFTFEWKDFPWGSEYYGEHGQMMADGRPRRAQDLRRHLLRRRRLARGPRPRQPVGSAAEDLPGLRPVRQRPPGASSSRASSPHSARPTTPTSNWVVVRENTEGEYAGIGGRNLSARGQGGEVAIQSALFTEEGCERIMRFAFELARTRRRRRSPASRSPTPSSTAWCSGTTCSRGRRRLPRHGDRDVAGRRHGRQVRAAPRDLDVVVA